MSHCLRSVVGLVEGIAMGNWTDFAILGLLIILASAVFPELGLVAFLTGIVLLLVAANIVFKDWALRQGWLKHLNEDQRRLVIAMEED